MVVTGEIQEAKRESLAIWLRSRGDYGGNSGILNQANSAGTISVNADVVVGGAKAVL